MNWTQIFGVDVNCYALSIFRVFILLASSDSDKHMLLRQKVFESQSRVISNRKTNSRDIFEL